MGLPGNIIDPLGNDQLFDRNSGTKLGHGDGGPGESEYGIRVRFREGNPVSIIYDDTNKDQYTYNTDSQPLSYTDANGSEGAIYHESNTRTDAIGAEADGTLPEASSLSVRKSELCEVWNDV